MTRQLPDKNKPTLLICDSNVVIMVTIFKPSIMFSAQYTLGVLEIHSSAIEEMEKWIERGGAKLKKFGKPLIEDALKYSNQHTGKLKEQSEEERKRSHKVLSAMEAGIPSERKGAETSPTDKDLLSLARKNMAKLATQERTMRALAERTLGKDQLSSFEEMVLDLYNQSKLTKKDIEDGIEILIKMGESLRAEGRALLQEALNSAN